MKSENVDVDSCKDNQREKWVFLLKRSLMVSCEVHEMEWSKQGSKDILDWKSPVFDFKFSAV